MPENVKRESSKEEKLNESYNQKEVWGNDGIKPETRAINTAPKKE